MKKPIYTITIVVTLLAILSNRSDDELARIFSNAAEAIGLPWRIHPISEVCIQGTVMFSEDCVPFSLPQNGVQNDGEIVLITVENTRDSFYTVVEKTNESTTPCPMYSDTHLPENQLTRIQYSLPSKGNNSKVPLIKSTRQNHIP